MFFYLYLIFLCFVTSVSGWYNNIPRSDSSDLRQMTTRFIKRTSAITTLGVLLPNQYQKNNGVNAVVDQSISGNNINYQRNCECKDIRKCLCQKEYNPSNERIYSTTRKTFLPASASQKLSDYISNQNNKVVTIGEVHSNLCHHHCEFEVVRSLANSNKNNIAVGLECFYRQHQNALDSYIFEHKDIGKLKDETSWDEAWGFDLNYYAKLFQFCKSRGIRLIGLNVPYPVAAYVGQNGYDSLPDKMKNILPNIDISNNEHKDQFMKLLLGGAHATESNVDNRLNRMYEAQCLWEEYMSESAANYINKNPDSTLCVIAGLGHIMGRNGIPSRIKKRIKNPVDPFVILPQQVEWSTETGLPIIDKPLTNKECDWAWYTESSDNQV